MWGYGWLTDLTKAYCVDFAGRGSVHMTAGVGALVGAVIAGPQEGTPERARLFMQALAGITACYAHQLRQPGC